MKIGIISFHLLNAAFGLLRECWNDNGNGNLKSYNSFRLSAEVPSVHLILYNSSPINQSFSAFDSAFGC